MVELQACFETLQDWFAWAFQFLSQFDHFLDGLSEFGDIREVQTVIFFNKRAEVLLMVVKELIDDFMDFVFHCIENFDIVLNNLFEGFIGHDSLLIILDFA